MRISAEPALPGPVSSGGPAGRPAGDGNADAGFDRLLRQAEKEPPAKGQPAAEPTPRQPLWPDNADAGFDRLLRQAEKEPPAKGQPAAEPTRRQPLWPDFAARLADKATETGEEPAISARDDTGKPSDDDPRIGDSKAKRNDKHPPQAQDQAPLLAALSGVHRNLATANEKNTGDALTTAPPDLDGNTPAGSPKNGAKAEAKMPAVDQPASVAAPLSAGKNSAAEVSLAAQAGNPKATPVVPGSAGQADGASSPGLPEVDANGQDEPVKPAPSNRAMPENTSQTSAVRHSVPDRQAASSAPVTVTAEQHFPAPAAHPASQTATSLASAIATDSGIRQALSPSAGLVQPAAPVAVASHILKIELHPAELGMVTANLRLVGGQLSIELKPENHEAHRKLSSDTDTLVKSLQGMGFTVDKVIVLQPSIAITATPRPDGTNPSGGNSSSFQPGNSGGNGEPSGGRQSGGNHGNESQNGGRNTSHPRQRAGGDLFI